MGGADVFQALACLAYFQGRSATTIGLPIIFWAVRVESLCHALPTKKLLPIQAPQIVLTAEETRQRKGKDQR
jgi:hypothetical protein